MGDMGIGLLERCVVLRERCGGDERVVVLERRAAGLLVYYGTRGELTSEAFGSAWRVSCVRLGEEREAGLVCALHGEPSAGLADAIRSYFSQKRHGALGSARPHGWRGHSLCLRVRG